MQQNMQNGYNEDTMFQAKPIVPDKFWIVEKNGEKVGTLRRGKEYILTVNSKNARFPDQETLTAKTKISFSNLVEIQAPVTDDFEVHGYPCKTKPHNEIFDVKRKLPLYTKTPKSQSFHCAGYYIINFDNGWMKSYCPKLITLTRNQFEGPYKTKFEMQEQLRLAHPRAGRHEKT